MHLRHISPKSMDWLDAMFEGGGEAGGGQRGGGSLKEIGSRPRLRRGRAATATLASTVTPAMAAAINAVATAPPMGDAHR